MISPRTSPINTGTVKWFDRKKGFGFAAPDAGGDDIFLHQLNLQNDSEGKRPFVNEGDALSYDIGEYNGRPSALNITMLSTQTRLPRHRRRQAETAIQPEAPVVSTASMQPDGAGRGRGRGRGGSRGTPGQWKLMHQYGLSGDMDFEAAAGIGQALEATENGDPQETFSVRERRQQNVEARDSAAASFGRALESDEALRAQCKNVESFKRAYTHWRDARVDSGETAALPKCSPAQVLWQLRSMKDELRKQLGVAWLTVVGKAVYVGSRRGSLAGAERQVRESREAAEKDKQGIQVRPLPPQPVFAGVAEPGLLLCSTLRVRNTSEDACKLADVKLLKRSTTGFSATSQPAVLLEPGAELKLQLRFCTQNAGMSSDVLTLRFESCRPGQPSRFNISRYLDIRCGDAAELDELAPTAPYKKRRRQRRPARDETEVVEAPPEPRARGASQPKPVGYKPYNIDAAFRRELETEEAAVRLEDGAERLKLTTRDALPHYKKHMQRLLWAEEHQLVRDLEQALPRHLRPARRPPGG